ncbi:MAG: hypothetical protein M3150_10675 [Pseudomonadota bacterium]|nr:hypothetical protein [Pseudomonadota bacterium]
MDQAPAVSYPVGRPLVAGLLAGGLWLAGAVVTLVWTFEADAPGWRQGAAMLAVGACGAYALLSWIHLATGELHWDGVGWTAPGALPPGLLEVALDLQRLVLVRWIGPGRSRWLWLEQKRCPQRWRDLRRAVYSRARPTALPAGRPPAATP